MEQFTHRIPAVAAAAIVVSGALAAAAGSSTARTQIAHANAGRTLHLVERGGGLKVVDNPPKARHQYDFSAGDIVIVTRDITSARGGGAGGSLRLVCVATSAMTQQCNGAEALPGGTLELAGTSAPQPTTTVAVIGGTGAYAGAHGTSVSRDRKTNADIADQTITLLP